MVARTRKKIVSNTNGKAINGKPQPEEQIQVFEFLRRMVTNQEFSRSALTRALAGGGHFIDEACGYPIEISFSEYKRLIERDGIANRANSIFAKESWSACPYVYETESVEGDAQTPFEKGWENVVNKNGVLTDLSLLDEIAGYGHYGVLLIGTNDGLPLDRPFPGINSDGELVGDPKPHEITYLMPFDEGGAQINGSETNTKSKRYGRPLYYNMLVANPNVPNLSGGITQKIHWTRCLHVADGCTTSKIFGAPRLEKVYNYLVNIRKILGGSAEMFWNGGFPGTMFEVPPELVGTGELDKVALTKEIEEYLDGFKRYLALSGIQAKQLVPNIADPDTHLNVQMQALTIALEVPLRIFMGSEEARMASQTDSEAWNRRVHRKQDLYVTPNILRPFVERLVMMGVLPQPKQIYIKWPDVYAVSASAKADITGKLVRALAEYVKSGAYKLFPPLQLLTMLMDLSTDEAEEVLLAAEEVVKSGKYDYLDPPIPVTASKTLSRPQAGRRKALGATRKVKKIPSPSINVGGVEVVVNVSRCQRDGMPGFKHGQGGKCYTYTEGDAISKKKAMRKAKLQGATIEVAKMLQNEEASDENS